MARTLTSPGRIFLGLGVALAGLFLSLASSGARIGATEHLLRLGAAAGVYGIAMLLLARGRHPGTPILLVCLGLALAARAPLVVEPAGRQDDTHRYLWDARLQRAGLNPYLVRPDDPSVAWLHTTATRSMNNQDVPSPYPPGAQYFFRFVTAISESAVAIKAALVVAECVTVLALWWWLRARGLDPGWTLAYAWHPVVIFETASGGHLDALGVMFLVVAAASLSRCWRLAAALAVAASVSIKLLPVVLAPLIIRRVRPWQAALGGLCLAAAYVPFIDGWRVPVGSLGAVVDRFRFNELGFDLITPVVGAQAAAGVALAAGLALSWLLSREPAGRRTGGSTAPDVAASGPSAAAWAWPMAASLLLAPMIYPWYLIWLVPFAVTLATVPLLVWSLAVLLVYRVWAIAAAGGPWEVPPSLLAWEYGLVLAAGVVVVLISRRTAARR